GYAYWNLKNYELAIKYFTEEIIRLDKNGSLKEKRTDKLNMLAYYYRADSYYNYAVGVNKESDPYQYSEFLESARQDIEKSLELEPDRRASIDLQTIIQCERTILKLGQEVSQTSQKLEEIQKQIDAEKKVREGIRSRFVEKEDIWKQENLTHSSASGSRYSRIIDWAHTGLTVRKYSDVLDVIKPILEATRDSLSVEDRQELTLISFQAMLMQESNHEKLVNLRSKILQDLEDILGVRKYNVDARILKARILLENGMIEKRNRDDYDAKIWKSLKDVGLVEKEEVTDIDTYIEETENIVRASDKGITIDLTKRDDYKTAKKDWYEKAFFECEQVLEADSSNPIQLINLSLIKRAILEYKCVLDSELKIVHTEIRNRFAGYAVEILNKLYEKKPFPNKSMSSVDFSMSSVDFEVALQELAEDMVCRIFLELVKIDFCYVNDSLMYEIAVEIIEKVIEWSNKEMTAKEYDNKTKEIFLCGLLSGLSTPIEQKVALSQPLILKFAKRAEELTRNDSEKISGLQRKIRKSSDEGGKSSLLYFPFTTLSDIKYSDVGVEPVDVALSEMAQNVFDKIKFAINKNNNNSALIANLKKAIAGDKLELKFSSNIGGFACIIGNTLSLNPVMINKIDNSDAREKILMHQIVHELSAGAIDGDYDVLNEMLKKAQAGDKKAENDYIEKRTSLESLEVEGELEALLYLSQDLETEFGIEQGKLFEVLRDIHLEVGEKFINDPYYNIFSKLIENITSFKPDSGELVLPVIEETAKSIIQPLHDAIEHDVKLVISA
ncbi:hypothetical protein KKC59_02460, partial [bacterium]|nr:hypothetical protein [bacterium]